MKRLWFDLGKLGQFANPRDATTLWQDHGLGLLRTIMFRHGVSSDVASLRNMANWGQVADMVADYDLLLMNVRSYTFSQARQVAKIFKEVQPKGMVLVGGMNTLVDLEGMVAEPALDRICQGGGEEVIVDLARDPHAFPRVVTGQGARGMAEWPFIDRILWPVPKAANYPFPLEPAIAEWGPSPMVSMLTSRICPWRCSFCNESSYIPNLERKPVEQVVDELNWLDRVYGPIGSVVFHDSMFFQQPSWLEEWAEVYPRKARKLWPYWAAARPDTVRRWPDLFARVVAATHWQTISLGLESGSDRTLQTYNKECTAEDNLFAILRVNQIGDDLERMGRRAPRLFANIIFGAPGETREDALDTMRMISFIKRPLFSISRYAPYPGSALGYQLIAEGKSLMDSHERYSDSRYVAGVDYDFLHDLERGAYTGEIMASRVEWVRRVTGGRDELKPLTSFRRQNMYLFSTHSGKKKLSFGTDPAQAFQTLSFRLTPEELQQVDPSSAIKVHQSKMHEFKDQLG